MERYDDGIDWSGLPKHLTVETVEELIQKIEEGQAASRAGRTRPIDDAVDDILRKIENRTLLSEDSPHNP